MEASKIKDKHFKILIPLWVILIFSYALYPKIYLKNVPLDGINFLFFETIYDVIVLMLVVMWGVLVNAYIKNKKKNE